MAEQKIERAIQELDAAKLSMTAAMLREILERHAYSNAEEKAIASDQLAHWQEMEAR
jgi:hypothetical protein